MDDLFREKWTEHYQKRGIKHWCPDGAGRAYQNTSPRVLFVLKDPNKRKGEDMVIQLNRGPQWVVWHQVARWAAGILYQFPPFDEINKRSVLKEALCSVAVLNLKKATGRDSSDHSLVNAIAFQDRHLLMEQFQCLRPEIIIACGTFDPLVWLLQAELKLEITYSGGPSDTQEVRIVGGRWGDALIVPWRHPSRSNKQSSYDRLKERVGSVRAAFGL